MHFVVPLHPIRILKSRYTLSLFGITASFAAGAALSTNTPTPHGMYTHEKFRFHSPFLLTY